MTTVYLNGEYLPLEQAKISVMDRGFLFGDGIYEVIPVFNGKFFRLEQHLTRLENSLRSINLDVDVSSDEWRNIFQRLIDENGNGHQIIYLQVTRGAEPIRNHAFPKCSEATIFARLAPIANKSVEEVSKGIKVMSLEDTRWKNCYIKSVSLLPNVMMYQEALSKGYDEAILIRDGNAIEGTSCNLFIVKDDVIVTPPADGSILGGVTRDLILSLAKQHQMPFEERPIPLNELKQADEIWVSSSGKEIRPVISLDDKPVGGGKAGPVWHALIQHYEAFKQQA